MPVYGLQYLVKIGERLQYASNCNIRLFTNFIPFVFSQKFAQRAD